MTELSEKQPFTSKAWSVLILAAGYGTRLVKDLKNNGSHEYISLLNLPKALIPISGVPLLDYWFHDLSSCPYININDFTSLLTINFTVNNIINDGTDSNETRLGAVGDIALCIDKYGTRIRQSYGVIIIAGDTLFYEDFQLNTFLDRIMANQKYAISSSGILYYNIIDEMETLKRGIVEVDESSNRVMKLLEKPHPSSTSSRKACPAFYAYHNSILDSILCYYKESLHLPLEERDAPGKLLSWLIDQQEQNLSMNSLSETSKNHMIVAYEIKGRFDIGNLIEYEQTMEYFDRKFYSIKIKKSLPTCISDRCYARVGFLGNPSDGFHGKTLSFLIKNFYAEVMMQENDDSSDSHHVNDSNSTNDSNSSNNNISSESEAIHSKYLGIHYKTQVEIYPHPIHDPFSFSNLQSLQVHSIITGYYGGCRLLQATCKVFSQLCFKNGIYIHLQRGFKMTYDTCIPRMVGLSGSSAIVVAAFRCLMKYYGLTLEDLQVSQTDYPQIILDIEREELSISAGLQDRVIQTHGGLVFMDFTSTLPMYTSLDPSILPCLYLAYNINAGGESGKVHSTVKDRWNRKDPELIQGMNQLGEYAQEAIEVLRSKNIKRLGELMELNFLMRRKLYGDEVVGRKNITVAELIKSLGLICKFTGSGGAFICIRKDGINSWLEDNHEIQVKHSLKAHGFELIRIEIPV